MLRRIRKTLVSFLIAALCVQSVPVRASSLDDALGWMYLSTTTEARAYESQRRMGFVGGSVMARTPIKNVNIISFAPPRLDAGCGGIDLFMGSFSFINMDQFVQLLRAIAANAVGLAFKAALHAISPTLEAIISKLETLVNNMNRTFRNSCSIAQSIPSLMSGVGSLFDSIKQASTEVADRLRTSSNIVDDFFSALKSNFSDPNAPYKSESKPDLNPSVGNLVWKALMLNNTAAAVGPANATWVDPFSSNSKLMAMYVMSITGTVINMQDEDYDPNQCEGGSSGDRCGVVARSYGRIVHFRDLLDGNSNGNKPQYYQCNTDASEMGCTKLTPVDFSFIGTRAYTNVVLFGTEDGSYYTGDSLVGRVIEGGELNQYQKDLLQGISSPILAAMMNVQNDPNAVLTVATLASPIIAEEAAVGLGIALVKAAHTAFSGQYKVDKPAEFDENLKQFQREMAPYIQNAEKIITQVNQIATYTTFARKSFMPNQ